MTPYEISDVAVAAVAAVATIVLAVTSVRIAGRANELTAQGHVRESASQARADEEAARRRRMEFVTALYEWRYPTKPWPSFDRTNSIAFNTEGARRRTAIYNAASRYVEYDAAAVVVWCEARDALAQVDPTEALARSGLERVTTWWLDQPASAAKSLREEADRMSITLGAELEGEQNTRGPATLE